MNLEAADESSKLVLQKQQELDALTQQIAHLQEENKLKQNTLDDKETTISKLKEEIQELQEDNEMNLQANEESAKIIQERDQIIQQKAEEL